MKKKRTEQDTRSINYLNNKQQMKTLLEKRNHIRTMVTDMLNIANEAMINKIDKALSCGAIDLDDWSEDCNPMVLPKCIIIALLEDEADQYKAAGTKFEKQVKNEVKNLKYYL